MTLEQHIKDVIEAATRQLSGQVSERLQGMAADISRAATEERVSVVRELRMAAEAEIAKRSQEAVAATQAEHARRLEEAVAAARQEGARRMDEAVAVAKAEQARRIDEAVAAAKAALTREHQTELMSARADVSRKIEDAVAAVRRETSSHHDALVASIRAEAARSLTEAVSRTRDEAERHVARAREEAEHVAASARQEAARNVSLTREEADQQISERIEAARREARQMVERSLVDARAAERQADLAQVERLVEAVRRIDAARSLTDALDVLVEVAAKEVPRVAVFMARGTRVMGWKGAGMPVGTDLRRMEIASSEGGLIPRAVRTASAVTTSDSPDAALMTTPFGVLPTDAAGLAIALRVGGEPVAVLYADDAADHRREVPNAWPEAIELLARHASRCLEVLTVARVATPIAAAPAMGGVADLPPSPRFAPHARAHAAISDTDDDAARRYAKLLVSEIKLYHESAVAQGRRDANLLQRLRQEVDRARTLYDDRVPPSVRTRADYFDEELVRTLANGDRRLLGQA